MPLCQWPEEEEGEERVHRCNEIELLHEMETIRHIFFSLTEVTWDEVRMSHTRSRFMKR